MILQQTKKKDKKAKKSHKEKPKEEEKTENKEKKEKVEARKESRYSCTCFKWPLVGEWKTGHIREVAINSRFQHEE